MFGVYTSRCTTWPGGGRALERREMLAQVRREAVGVADDAEKRSGGGVDRG